MSKARQQQPDRTPRPRTLREAREIVEETYQFTDWNERDRRYYENALGLDDKPLPERSIDEIRIILGAMEKSRMVLFEEEVNGR